MPIPPRVSVVALQTADLARSTAFYVALGWELSPASTSAMSLFKTAGSLLLVCTDELLTDLGGQELAAALAGEPTGEAVLSIHVASDAEVDAALQEAASAGGRVVKGAAPTPLGGSYGFFADPDGHLWEVIHHPLYQLGSDGRPEVPQAWLEKLLGTGMDGGDRPTQGVVERLMNRRKQFRAVATRSDKLAVRYQGTIAVADSLIWLRARPDRSRSDPRTTP